MYQFMILFLMIVLNSFVISNAKDKLDPTVRLTSNSKSIEAEKLLNAKCSVTEYHLSSEERYGIRFYLNSTNFDLNLDQENILFADYAIKKNLHVTFHINETFPDEFGLNISQGLKSKFPDFEIALQLLESDNSNGFYQCSFVHFNESLPNGFEEFFSNVQKFLVNKQSPSVKFFPIFENGEFKIGIPFTGLCEINGTEMDSVHWFNLSYHFVSKLDQPFVIGFYEVFPNENLTGNFTASNVDFLGLSIAIGGEYENFPYYEIQITPKSTAAEGQYYCSITVLEDAFDDTWMVRVSDRVATSELQSHEIKSSSDIIPQMFFVFLVISIFCNNVI